MEVHLLAAHKKRCTVVKICFSKSDLTRPTEAIVTENYNMKTTPDSQELGSMGRDNYLLEKRMEVDQGRRKQTQCRANLP